MASHAVTKPMLAATLPPDQMPTFPVLATPKLDGIRALKQGGSLVSRSYKLIPNLRIRKALEVLLPDGADGEIVVGKTFQECTSAVMTIATATETPVSYFWFDHVSRGVKQPYEERVQAIREYAATNAMTLNGVTVVPLLPTLVKSAEELAAFEEDCLDQGFEGVIVRRPDGPYKQGRSTLKEGYLLKIKRFSDAEATVVDAEEMMHNKNDATTDAFGSKKHSHHQAGMVAAGVLGALVVETADGVRFNVGTGFSMEDRKTLWGRRKTLIGKLVRYKYFEVGVKTAPRHPVFLGFRHADDL